MAQLSGPHISINYTPAIDLSLTCVRMVKHEAVSQEYSFAVKCHFRHPTGYFENVADDVYLEPKNFVQFANEPRDIQQGVGSTAPLQDIGKLFVFSLFQENRHLHLVLSIRESMPAGKLATLKIACEVDHDLFVNKQHHKLEEFLEELCSV